MSHVVATSRLLAGALDALSAHRVSVLSENGAVPRQRLLESVADADALLCLLTDRVDAELLERAPRLRVIGICAVGYDNIDVEAAGRRGIMVLNTPNVLSDATADLAFGLLLAAARRVAEADRFVRAGEFDRWRLDLLLGVPVHGQTLGIVGCGRIGQRMALRARGFEMRVLYTQRSRLPAQLERKLGVDYVNKRELLRQSDFVSLHLPLNAGTRHWLDRDAISELGPRAVVVNTGRGALIDEAALAETLGAGRIFAAGLDVFENEPAVHPRLLELPNVVLAPHIGSATDETRFAMARAICRDVARALAGEAPENRVK